MSLFKSVHGCIFIYIYYAIQLFYINIVWSLDYTGLDRLKKKSKSTWSLDYTGLDRLKKKSKSTHETKYYISNYTVFRF